MNDESMLKNVWPALSFTLLFVFINLCLYILLALESNFPIYVTIIISNLFLATAALFLELSGLREKLWSVWRSWPTAIHKIICGICVFWIGLLSFKALIPAIKKDYEKH